MSRSTLPRLVVVICLVAAIVAAFAAGDRLEANARQVWLARAARETQNITDVYLFWLTTYQAQLRGAAGLFHASSEVDEDELFDALDVIEGLEAAVPLETVAFAQPGPEGWVVGLSTDIDGLVATGADIRVPQMVRVIEDALELPDRVVMGTPFADGERQLTLLAVAAPNAERMGAVITTIDLTTLLQNLEDLHVPDGLQMAITAESEGADGRHVERVWGTDSPTSVQEYSYGSDSGQVHWRFLWNVQPNYRGGADTELARVVQMGSVLVIALVGFVIGLLLRQNLRVQRQVELRTAELEISVLEAQAANRSKSVFLANVSHEIRTPLNAIMGFAEVLDRQLTDPQQRQHLHVMQESSESLLLIISGILDLSRLEAGQLALQTAPTDALAIFTDIGQKYRQQARNKKIDLQIQIDPSVPPVLILDGARLRDVLEPLVDNALKFTTEGYVRVAASAQPGVEAGTVDLTMRVSDTGVGIPPDQQTHIFELFRQRDGQSINEYGGTGLGLTIVRQLVELMDGRIDIESREGHGSIFTAIVPNVSVGAHDLIQQLSQPQEATLEGMAESLPIGFQEMPASLRPLLAAQASRCQHLLETQTIHEVEEFAQEISRLGEDHEYPALQEMGNRLQQQASGFDMTGMEQTLACFADLRSHESQRLDPRHH